MKKERGAILFETLFLLVLLAWLGAKAHIEITKLWRAEIAKLQKERYRYDGVKLWMERRKP